MAFKQGHLLIKLHKQSMFPDPTSSPFDYKVQAAAAVVYT